jgi:hypothetical protein
MKTAIAYLLSIGSLFIAEPIIGLLFFPLLAYLKRINAELLYWLEGIISTIVSCFAVVLLSTVIFGWLSVEYSLLPIIVMLVLSTINNFSRLARSKGTDRFPMEFSYTIGGTVGFILGALYFIYAVPLKIIISIAAVPVVILLYCLSTSRQKSFPFWKLVSEIPDKAYEWFQNDSCWIIYDPPSGKNEVPDINEYNGGFFLYVPSLNRKITVYGNIDLIEESEKRFIEQYSGGMN